MVCVQVPGATEQQEEGRAHGTITFKTYLKFFRAGANFIILAIVVIIFMLGEVSYPYAINNYRV